VCQVYAGARSLSTKNHLNFILYIIDLQMDEIIQYYNERREEIEEILSRASIKLEIVSIIANMGPRIMVQIALNSVAAIDQLLNEQLSEIYTRDDDDIAEFAPGIDLNTHVLLMLATTAGDETYVHLTTSLTYGELGLSRGADGELTINEIVLVNRAKYDALYDRVAVISMQSDYHVAAKEAAGGQYQPPDDNVVMMHVKSIIGKYTKGTLDFEATIAKLDNIMKATEIPSNIPLSIPSL